MLHHAPLALINGAKAIAAMQGRDFAPEDIIKSQPCTFTDYAESCEMEGLTPVDVSLPKLFKKNRIQGKP
ncbi:hypothetical protein CS542_04765 [Pedobacter sp. IW39]|nr:hypothetical protein CS542_04765 [Pedobacter sp. IW39]